MMTELLAQEGKMLENIIKLYGKGNKVKQLILSFSDKVDVLNGEEEEILESVKTFHSTKEKPFFIFDKSGQAAYRELTEEEEEEVKNRRGFVLSSIAYKTIAHIKEEDGCITLTSEEGKSLMIDMKTLRVIEEKDSFRIMRGMTIETVKTLAWDDIRSKGTSMYHRMMNAIVGKEVVFTNMTFDDVIYEGDILELTYHDGTSFRGMLLYNFKKHEYVLKHARGEEPIHSKKRIKKAELVRTFFDVQTSLEMFSYFNQDEINLIQQEIMNYQAVSLGIGSLLSLVFENEEDSLFFYENVILNGTDPTIIQEYVKELFDKHPIRIIEQVPTVAFLLPYAAE